MRQLKDIARDVVEAWNRWADAPGWDNNEYDGLAEALHELEDAIHVTRAMGGPEDVDQMPTMEKQP